MRRVNHDTWRRTFRLALGHQASDEILEVEAEDELLHLVINRRLSVRCATRDGKSRGMFRLGADPVRQVLLHDEAE